MTTQIPIFIYDECIACGICVQACPVSTLALSRTDIDQWKKAYPARTDRPCIGCAQCEKACPMGAIVMEEGLQ